VRGDCTEKARPETAIETEKDVPLLEVLNRIAKAHNGAVWGYVEYHCDEGTLFSLNAITE
jgi:hypothetical protein